jgi:tRNA (adenine37-N6)-methyltransferase
MPTREDFHFRAIGIIRSPYLDPAQTPIQPVFAPGVAGRVELFAEYAEGLKDLKGFSHVHLLYVLHFARMAKLQVKPFLHDVEHGIFATRSPTRPNPIGISIVRLVRIEDTVLHVEDMDIVDGTPLLDIKPYAPRFDVREGARSGWMEEVDEATALRRGRRAGRSPDQF